MQKRESYEKPFDHNAQNEIFFVMKVYAVKDQSTADGKVSFSTFKYTVDFHPPFEANGNSVEPYASPVRKENIPVFKKIFDHVKDVIDYIANPTGYGHEGKSKQDWRHSEQKNLDYALRSAENAINYITYEQNSPGGLSVGAVYRSTGNGDMRPPK